MALLQKNGVDVEVVEYLKTPLNFDEISALYKALDIENAHKMIRPKETEFTLAKLEKSSNDNDVLKAIAEYPKLLERPILLVEDKAVIGRPPEDILTLL